MSASLILPRVTSFRVTGFQPIFNTDVHASVKTGPCLILGGNGLGKTTLMQAIVYGLTGGVTEEIEEDKRQRWGHAYFRSRLGSESGKTALVEVTFQLAKEQISVRRGLTGSQVVGVRSRSTGQKWVDSDNAHLLYEELLREHGGYNAISDFAFVVTRLLYLPENRRLLAWDTDAQTRVLMLVNRDVSIEHDFRERRKELKLMDSRKRHIHVQLGHANEALSSLDEEATEETDEQDETPVNAEGSDLLQLLDRLADATKARIEAADSLSEIDHTISAVSSEVESLHLAIEEVEGKLVFNLLDRAERERSLALHKLLESAICPSCGTRQRDLQATAKEYYQAHKCCLCGSEQPQITNPELAEMRSRLADRMTALSANEQAYSVLEQRLNILRKTESDLQFRVNRIRFQQPVLNIPDQSLSVTTRQDLLRRKRKLEADEAELALQIRELQAELEAEYEGFLAAVSDRLKRLRSSYEQYASEFLGITCTLTSTDASDRLLGLTAFVPQFGGSTRPTPESCSEAQRFFLDIAFRMALVDLASELGGAPSCFICETPENALDVSYIDNVVQMFKRFMARRHVLIFSANLQDAGIAEKIMGTVAKSERASRVINLLQYGQLTEVHRKALRRLTSLAKKVTG